MKFYVLQFLVVFFLCTHYTEAQSNQDLVGKWLFKNVVPNQDTDIETKDKIKMMKNLFVQSYFILNENGSGTSAILNKPQRGEWQFVDSFLLFNADKGESDKLKIVDFEGEELTLITEKFSIKFFKTNFEEKDNKFTRIPKVKKVTTTENEMIGKWYITKIHANNEMTATLPEGVIIEGKSMYYNLKGNGKYKTKVDKKSKEKGVWKLSAKKNQLITTSNEGTKTVWNILKIDNNELAIKRGRSGKSIYFKK